MYNSGRGSAPPPRPPYTNQRSGLEEPDMIPDQFRYPGYGHHPWIDQISPTTAFNRRTELLEPEIPHQFGSSKRLDLDSDILREQTASGLLFAKESFSRYFQTKNAVLSPLSVQILLSMVVAGVAGPLKEQLLSFLGAKSDQQLHTFVSQVINTVFSDCSSTGGPKLSTANAAWLSDSLTYKSSFKQAIETHYKAGTKYLDFKKVEEAVDEINAWAEKETNGLIKNVVSPSVIHHTTLLVMANAVYFKGEWSEKFNKRRTKDGVFHLEGGGSSRVAFMRSWNDQFIATYDGFKVLQLHYKKGNNQCSYSMCIFLPNDRDGLPRLLQRACSESGFLNRHIPQWPVKVGEFRIPKFKIEVNLEKVLYVLEQLGLTMGPFTEMAEEHLGVSTILQKAFVEVNEEGTEAAAVAVMVCYGGSGIQSPKVNFVADHPFMFLIRENTTGLVLFVGQVLNPASSSLASK